MSNKENTTNRKNNRIRSSLVIKLNLRMIGRLIGAFFAINMLLLLLGLFFIFWKAEEGAQDILYGIEQAPNDLESIYIGAKNYKIVTRNETPKGFVLPRSIQKYLPVKSLDAKRSIQTFHYNKNKKLLEEIESVKYFISVSILDQSYQVIYALGRDLRWLFNFFFLIFIFEILLIVGNSIKGLKSIRKTLKPLSDLAETARNMNTKVNDIYIKNLAGAISGIDAKKLDKRISVDDSQNELKDLAAAINDMLNRIHESYQSQVRFVSDASHELRTPISVIQGYINLLDRWGKNDPKAMQESIDAIKGETENMKSLVEQLLFLARGDNETMQLHKEDFDSCEVVEETIRETQMIDLNHEFELGLMKPATIHADKQLFKQAIRILIDNCIKYTPDGKKISLKVHIEGELVLITVQDSGIGIEPEDLSHVFDRFYRSDESRARKTGGSGLGLSIAKWIIESHQGNVEIISRVDIGTRITIAFPRVERYNEIG